MGPGRRRPLLATANDRRFLIKVSFRHKQERTPLLEADADIGGLLWSFEADQLQPAQPYNLQVLSAAKKALCAPWTLKTLPAPDYLPQRLRLTPVSVSSPTTHGPSPSTPPLASPRAMTLARPSRKTPAT